MQTLIFLFGAALGGNPKRPGLSIDEIANRLRGEATVASSKQQALTEDDNVRGHSRVGLRRSSTSVETSLRETARDLRRSISVAGVVSSANDESFGRVSDAIRYKFTTDALSLNVANKNLIPRIRGMLSNGQSVTDQSIGVRLEKRVFRKRLPHCHACARSKL